MTQRKLNPDELQKVMAARHDIKQMCNWNDTERGSEYWHGVEKQLDAMANHATTDGKPYVDPEPPIPDGYRLAVASDEARADCKLLGAMGWTDRDSCRVGTAFTVKCKYIVPADRTPTDEDAKSRPEVMVRDGSEPWHKVVLYGVLEKNAYPFVIVQQTSRVSGRFKYARHLYPGE